MFLVTREIVPGFSMRRSILVLISLVGNTLVILTVLINKPVQTTLNYILVNLAVADIVVALSIGITHVMMSNPPRRKCRQLCLCPFRRWRCIYVERIGQWYCIQSVFGVHCLNATLPLFIRFANVADLPSDVKNVLSLSE